MGSMADNPWQKEKISEIEDTVIKTILNETQKEKKKEKSTNSVNLEFYTYKKFLSKQG